MSLESLRKKPRHIRMMYVFLTLSIVAALLVVVWIVTFTYESDGKDALRSIGDSVSKTFSNPAYSKAF